MHRVRVRRDDPPRDHVGAVAEVREVRSRRRCPRRRRSACRRRRRASPPRRTPRSTRSRSRQARRSGARPPTGTCARAIPVTARTRAAGRGRSRASTTTRRRRAPRPEPRRRGRHVATRGGEARASEVTTRRDDVPTGGGEPCLGRARYPVAVCGAEACSAPLCALRPRRVRGRLVRDASDDHDDRRDRRPLHLRADAVGVGPDDLPRGRGRDRPGARRPHGPRAHGLVARPHLHVPVPLRERDDGALGEGAADAGGHPAYMASIEHRLGDTEALTDVGQGAFTTAAARRSRARTTRCSSSTSPACRRTFGRPATTREGGRADRDRHHLRVLARGLIPAGP